LPDFLYQLVDERLLRVDFINNGILGINFLSKGFNTCQCYTAGVNCAY